MNRYIIGGVVTLSVSIGSVAGYFVAVKRLEAKYAEIAEQEIAEAKKFYSRLNKKDEWSTPESAVKGLLIDEAATALRSYQGEGEAEVIDVEVEETVEEIAKTIKISDYVGEVVTNNVFENVAAAGLDVENRFPDKPYVVSLAEYMDNDLHHEQTTLSYFAGDDVLADERDEPMIDDVDETIGRFNLQRFGVGSGDPNIVMVRNEKLRMDFEISHSDGKFSKEVLGLDE